MDEHWLMFQVSPQLQGALEYVVCLEHHIVDVHGEKREVNNEMKINEYQQQMYPHMWAYRFYIISIAKLI